MEKTIVDLWKWQDQFGFVQAVETKAAWTLLGAARLTLPGLMVELAATAVG